MTELKTLIRESYDARPATDALSWASIQSRRPAKSRGLRWRLPALLAALALVGGGLSLSASSDPYRLPPTDFDVEVGFDSASARTDAYTLPDSGVATPGVKVLYNYQIGCRLTPSTFAASYVTLSLSRPLRPADKNVLIRKCQSETYSTEDYAAVFLAGARTTVGELRGGAAGSTTPPDAFRLCIAQTDPSVIWVFPGFRGITNMSQVCQRAAMHPLKIGAPSRPAFVIADLREYQAWLKRAVTWRPESAGFTRLDY